MGRFMLLVGLVYLCEMPGGHLRVTSFLTEDPGKRAALTARLEQEGTLPPPARCWTVPAESLPDWAMRPRWRRGPQGSVIVAPSPETGTK